MKKVLAILLALAMVLSFAACSANTGKDDGKKDNGTSDTASGVEAVKVDMSKYPLNLNEWTGQDLINYFKEAGVFVEKAGFESWEQEHAMYWDNTPVNGAVGYWDDAGTDASIMILMLGADNADTSEEQLNEWTEYIKANKTCPGDYSSCTVDHLVGNLAFEFETTIQNDDIYNQMVAAYNYLVESMGVTPEF